MVAARAHHWQVVQILICSGADPRAVYEARTYAGTLWSKDRAEATAQIESTADWKENWERSVAAKPETKLRTSQKEEGPGVGGGQPHALSSELGGPPSCTPFPLLRALYYCVYFCSLCWVGSRPT